MAKVCERCLKEFECGVSQSGSQCWCMALPVASSVPSKYSDCLCKECLTHFIEKDSKAAAPQMVEGMDFYYDDNGNWVFTEEYHLKRGYCCENSCKHCPY